MRTAIYLRLSKDRTGEGLGVDRQREDCRAYLNQHGWTLVGEHVDNDTSASSGRRRPGYEQLLADVEADQVDIIVAWHLDRLIRRPVDLEHLIDVTERHGVTIRLVRSGEIDPSTPSGRLIARQLGSFARFEVEAKSDRQRRESRQRAERGMPPGGRRAYGYSSSGREIVEEEAEAVRGAYRKLIGGHSLYSISAQLNEAGHKTTTGHTWRPGSVRFVLANPRNAAIRAHRGEIVGPAAWPAIVPEHTWRAALAVLSAPERVRNGNGPARRWLGTRLYQCGRCESEVSEMVVTYRSKRANGTNRRAYRCPVCKLTREAERVDTYVEAVIAERLRRDDLADLLAKPTADLAPLGAESAELWARRKAAPRLFADGVLSEAELRETRAQIDERLGEIQRLIAAAGRGSAVGPLLSAEDPGRAWLDIADVARRQAVVRELCTIRLLPLGSGSWRFDPATVDIT